MMGTGKLLEKTSYRSCHTAINNPLLDETSMKGAKAVLINITGGSDMTLFEVDEAANRIRKEIDTNANIIFGSALDDNLNGSMRVSLVATGMANSEMNKNENSEVHNLFEKKIENNFEKSFSNKNTLDLNISDKEKQQAIENLEEENLNLENNSNDQKYNHSDKKDTFITNAMDKSQASLEIDKHDIHLKNDIFDEKDFNLELNLENKVN